MQTTVDLFVKELGVAPPVPAASAVPASAVVAVPPTTAAVGVALTMAVPAATAVPAVPAVPAAAAAAVAHHASTPSMTAVAAGLVGIAPPPPLAPTLPSSTSSTGVVLLPSAGAAASSIAVPGSHALPAAGSTDVHDPLRESGIDGGLAAGVGDFIGQPHFAASSLYGAVPLSQTPRETE